MEPDFFYDHVITPFLEKYGKAILIRLVQDHGADFQKWLLWALQNAPQELKGGINGTPDFRTAAQD